MIDLRLGMNSKKECQTVIRLVTTAWKTSRGSFRIQKELIPMRRHSFNFDILEEDCSGSGALDMMDSIENLMSVDDGIYEVVTCNESREWETGIIDGYDLKLIPFTP